MPPLTDPGERAEAEYDRLVARWTRIKAALRARRTRALERTIRQMEVELALQLQRCEKFRSAHRVVTRR